MSSRNRVAEVVSAHWQKVFKVAEPDPAADFFSLGGNSLLAVTLVEGIERDLGINFPLEILFFNGTLGDVISACEAEVGAEITG